MNLTFLFSIPKCDYPYFIIENLFREPMIQGGHLAKPRWVHILDLGQHIDLTKQDILLPMINMRHAPPNESSKLVV